MQTPDRRPSSVRHSSSTGTGKKFRTATKANGKIITVNVKHRNYIVFFVLLTSANGQQQVKQVEQEAQEGKRNKKLEENGIH